MFVGIIPKEFAKNILFSTGEDNTEIEVIGDIQTIITINNNVIDKIVYDYSNTIKAGEEVYTKYVVTEKYYDIGNTIISVPDEVKNSATLG